MKPVRTALIFGYSPSGHASAARALADYLDPALFEPVLLNLSEIYPSLGPFVARTYLELLQKAPALWGYFYDNPLLAPAGGAFRKALIPIYSRKLKALLLKRGVRAAVCTHALATIMLARRERELRSMPLFAVVTDAQAHSFWPASGVTRYFVHTREAAAALEKAGAAPGTVTLSGIPVRREFLRREDPREARRRLGLNPSAFTVAISGGSRGLGGMLEAALEIAKLSPRPQLVFLCGENRRLCAEAGKALGGKRWARVVSGQDPADYFKAADLVAGKPGGVTLAELTALGKPFAAFSPLPGQEERNARWLTSRGAAPVADTPAELAAAVAALMASPAKLASAAGAMLAQARPAAGADIASALGEALLPGGRLC